MQNDCKNQLPPRPGVRAHAEPIGGEVVEVEEVGAAVVVEVTLGSTGTYEPEVAEVG